MKKFLALLISFSILISLGACSKKVETPEVSSQPEQKKDITLTVWHQYMPSVQTALEEAYADFTNETGIKLEFVKLEDFDKKVESAAQTGELPDLIMRSNDWTGKLSVMDAIQPIDDIADKAALEGVISNAVDGFRYKGQLYGVPAAVETVTLIYNKDLISQVPANTDELISKAKELTKDGKYGFLIPPKDAYYNSAFLYGAGGGYLDNEGNPTLNTTQNADAAKVLQELAKYYPKDLDHSLVTQLFNEGKAAMMVNGPWTIADIKKNNINYGLAKIPVVTSTGKSTPFMGVQGMLMTTKVKDKDAAIKAMNYFAGEKVGKALANSGGYIPANKAAREDSSITSNSDTKGFMDQSQVGVSMPNMPEMSVMWGPLDGTLQEIVILKEDPSKVLEKYQVKAEEEIKNMK